MIEAVPDTIEDFAAALSSAETDRVNRAIDDVGELSAADRAALFDDALGMCRDLFAADDGYQRQAVVRFADALYPRLILPTVGHEQPDEALPGDWTVEDAASHRTRLATFYLDALADEDGRARRSAANAIKQVAMCAAMVGADDELRWLLDQVSALGRADDGSDVSQIQQAYRNVAFYADRFE